MQDRLAFFVVFYPLMLFSLSFHEAAHAWSANRLGDSTARLMGRLTLNPFAHIDIIGTFVMPALAIFTGLPLIGWAKPVPVDTRYLKHPVRDHMWVALAGPVSNMILAIGFALLAWGIVFLPDPPAWMILPLKIAAMAVALNLALAIFNLIPIFPLDGGAILRGLIPARWVYDYDRLMSGGMWILLLLMITGALRLILIPVDFLANILLPPGL